MKPPIFVSLDGTLDVYTSKERAEAFNEAQSIAEYTCLAYDSEGYQLEVIATADNAVVIKPVDPPVKKADELRRLLQDFLKTIKTASVSDEWLADSPLNELVVKALEHKTW